MPRRKCEWVGISIIQLCYNNAKVLTKILSTLWMRNYGNVSS